MAHTPGPWIAQNVGGKGWFIVTEDDLILAMTLKSDDSDEADACLVAAAPELLSLLQRAAPYMKTVSRNDTGGYSDNDPTLYEDILAAIANAIPQAR
mgnify:CR=1 FL=1